MIKVLVVCGAVLVGVGSAWGQTRLDAYPPGWEHREMRRHEEVWRERERWRAEERRRHEEWCRYHGGCR